MTHTDLKQQGVPWSLTLRSAPGQVNWLRHVGTLQGGPTSLVLQECGGPVSSCAALSLLTPLAIVPSSTGPPMSEDSAQPRGLELHVLPDTERHTSHRRAFGQ